MTQVDLAALGGAKKHSQINYEADRTAPSTAYLTALGDHGVDIVYVLTGARGGVRATPAGGFEISDPASVLLRHGLHAAHQSLTDIHDSDTPAPPTANPDDFVNIPLHAALLAAGDGRENGTEEIIEYLAFRRDWLRRNGIVPGNAALARVDGESMQPSIWNGDMIMIDRSRVEVPVRARTTESRHRSPIYALIEDGKARVKRIERPTDEQLVLISDNPDYAPQFADPASVAVIGKVVWWGHTAKE